MSDEDGGMRDEGCGMRAQDEGCRDRLSNGRSIKENGRAKNRIVIEAQAENLKVSGGEVRRVRTVLNDAGTPKVESDLRHSTDPLCVCELLARARRTACVQPALVPSRIVCNATRGLL